jgi:hypothetical protein
VPALMIMTLWALGEWQDNSETGSPRLASLVTDTFLRHTPKSDRDHGCGVPGGWQDKSESPARADQAPRLTIEWTAHLPQPDASSSTLRQQ